MEEKEERKEKEKRRERVCEGEWRVCWDGETRRISASLSLCDGGWECVLCGGRCRWEEEEEEDEKKKERKNGESLKRFWSYNHLLVEE